MKPINFPQANALFKGAPGTNVGDLPVFRDSQQLISVHEVTAEDIKRMQATGKIYLLVQGQAQPPILLLSESPFVEFVHPFAFCKVEYKKAGQDSFMSKTIFVTGDFSIPQTIKLKGETYYIDTKKEEVVPHPEYKVKDLEWCFIRVNGQLKIRYISNVIDDWVDVEFEMK